MYVSVRVPVGAAPTQPSPNAAKQKSPSVLPDLPCFYQEKSAFV